MSSSLNTLVDLVGGSERHFFWLLTREEHDLLSSTSSLDACHRLLVDVAVELCAALWSSSHLNLVNVWLCAFEFFALIGRACRDSRVLKIDRVDVDSTLWRRRRCRCARHQR